MKTILVGIFLLATFHSSFYPVEAQVNFSPSWGKRTRTLDGNGGGGGGIVQSHQSLVNPDGSKDVLESFPPDTCTTPFDTIRRIQRLIQAEFQQMKLCENLNPERENQQQKILRST